jgi:cobyric acid synthase CobQ
VHFGISRFQDWRLDYHTSLAAVGGEPPLNGKLALNLIMSTKPIMLQGTGSDVGKSVIATALCRIFRQDGFRVAPFKSQNMALNSFVTRDGGEMGRAQVVQAQACRIEPHVDMNPILLKPTSDVGSQVIVEGKPIGNMRVGEYFEFKKTKALPIVKRCYERLAKDFDIIVIEGAGSPAEINLRDGDIVNMTMAFLADSPVVLIGDIDRGGVFASLVGTLELIQPEERERIKGMLINKFRGKKELLDSGLEVIEKRCGIPFLGVIPCFKDIIIPDEDSVALGKKNYQAKYFDDKINIEVVRLPHLSNFTDFDALELEPDVNLYYVNTPPPESSMPDVLIIPGSKHTIDDMRFLAETKFDERIKNLFRQGNTEIIGICGGYQILGRRIIDEFKVESESGTIEGLGLLPIDTLFEREKFTRQVSAIHLETGLQVKGYEIHVGQPKFLGNPETIFQMDDGRFDGTKIGNIWGTYLHGVFDEDEFRRAFIDRLRSKKGLSPLRKIHFRFDQDAEYDKLAELVRDNIDMEKVYEIVGIHPED